MNNPKVLSATQEELDELLALAKGSFPPEKYRLLEAVLETFVCVMQLLQNTKSSLERLSPDAVRRAHRAQTQRAQAEQRQ